jgi:multiple sugar transport system substrate-binding protein
MVYRAAVKTGVIFKDARTRRGQAVRRLPARRATSRPTSRARSAAGSRSPRRRSRAPFWKADRTASSVYNQFMSGTSPFEFTKNYKFTVLNNENVWAKAMNRDPQREGAGRQGDRRDDRAHQGGRGTERRAAR